MEKARQAAEDARARTQDLLSNLEDLTRRVEESERRLRALKAEEADFLAAREKKETDRVAELVAEKTRLEKLIIKLRDEVTALEEKKGKFATQVAELRTQLAEIKQTAESVVDAFKDKSYRR